MSVGHCLIVIGGIALLAGLTATFLSLRYGDRVMGEANLGIAVLSSDEDSHEMAEKKRLRWWGNFWFYLGLAQTGIGISLQTVGAVLAK